MMPKYEMQGGEKALISQASTLIAHGRECYERHEWSDAFEAFTAADQYAPLDASDLQCLAWSAGLTARDNEMAAASERLYHAHLNAQQELPAARAAFWLGFRLMALGEISRGNGWLSRAQRLADAHGTECVEQGYLLLPQAQKHLIAGEYVEAQAVAVRAADNGLRFAEKDLHAFAQNLQGRAMLANQQIERGLVLLDEAMVSAIDDELSPVVTGIIYCSSIASCHRVYALERVREWTSRLTTWCDARPQLGMFTRQCLAHRAEILEFCGAWTEAMSEAARAIGYALRDVEREAAGRAHYQQAEIHRLRGEYSQAEAAYLNAGRIGYEPQPGLALLRLAQGEVATAANTMRRVLDANTDPLQRTRHLPAWVDIALASGDHAAALQASRELADTAESLQSRALNAIAAHAAGSVALAGGDAKVVFDPARRAIATWHRLGAPYFAARAQVLLARACLSLGDYEGARMELANAREVFASLDAKPDIDNVVAITKQIAKNKSPHKDALSERELQVLKLIALGKTNKMIARELLLSEKTIARHLSNIFVKLNVSSRAAATALAYQRQLMG